MGEGLAGQPLQKAGQVNAHAAAVGLQGSDEKVMKISKLTCSCRPAWWFHIVLYLTFLDFFEKNTFVNISHVFHLFCQFFLTDQNGCGVYIKTRIFRKKSLLPPPLSPIGVGLKKYIFFKKVIFSTYKFSKMLQKWCIY